MSIIQIDENVKKKLVGVALLLVAVSLWSVQPVDGCTMDWKEDIQSNLYLFPRGIKRAGYDKGNTVEWTSKYGSIVATGYDIGTCDGMNEKGGISK